MQFLKEIRGHLKDFETSASNEIHKFIDFLHTKYSEPGPAVVAPPAPLGQPSASTFVAPVVDPTPAVIVEPTPIVEAAPVTVVEVVAEPVDKEIPEKAKKAK